MADFHTEKEVGTGSSRDKGGMSNAGDQDGISNAASGIWSRNEQAWQDVFGGKGTFGQKALVAAEMMGELAIPIAGPFIVGAQAINEIKKSGSEK
ncbi:MAG TPA: hypothetical protein V6D22_11570 [Candidatus Obscuribacterales bacterium]